MIWALLLPSVGTSLYFYSANQPNDKIDESNKPNGISTIENTLKTLDDANNCEKAVSEFKVDEKSVTKFSASLAFSQLSIQFKTSYSNPEVIKWSVWWAIAMCGYLQVKTIFIWWPRVGESNIETFFLIHTGAVLFTNALEWCWHRWAESVQRRSRSRKYSIWCGWRSCCRPNREQKIQTMGNMDSDTFHNHWRSIDGVGRQDHKLNGMLLRICAVWWILSFHDYNCEVFLLRSI